MMNYFFLLTVFRLYNLFIKKLMNQPFRVICYYEPFFPLLPQSYTHPSQINHIPPLYLILPPSASPQNQPFSQNKTLIQTFTQYDSFVTGEKKGTVKTKMKVNKKSVSRLVDQSFGLRIQNKNRNINSNILKSYLKYAFESPQMVIQVQKIASRLQIENRVSRFREYLQQKFPSSRSYVGLRYVQRLVGSKRGDDVMGQVLGVTLRSYLSKVYPLEGVLNVEMKRRQKLYCLKQARSIASTLFRK